jgi:predicted alpha-1,2-mannosidase
MNKATALKTTDIRPDIGIRCEGNTYARTYPGPNWPFGGCQPGPDCVTGWDYTNGYSHDLRYIEGFSFLRMSGVGWYGDYGNLQVMPTTGPLRTWRGSEQHPQKDESKPCWRSRFYHNTEQIETGYYAVQLHDYNIRAEMTATQHCGILRFTFPQADTARIQVDLARRIGGSSSYQEFEVVDDHTVEGHMVCGPEDGGFGNGHAKDLRYTVYFRMEFSRPLTKFGAWSVEFPEGTRRDCTFITTEEFAEFSRNATVHPGRRQATGEHLGFYTEFATNPGEQVLVKTGISFVDLDGARNNLQTELDHWDFVRVAGTSERQRTIAATAVYHAKLDPRRLADADGRYRDGRQTIRVQDRFNIRTHFSGWDAFRSYIPLMTLLDPELVNDQINSLLEVAQTTGKGLPKWEIQGIDSGCMVGDPAVPTIVDAYVKGIRNYDVELAYQLVKETATGPRTHREEYEQYAQLGYSPNAFCGLSTSMEYCYADWCIYQFAKAMGRDEDAATFAPRAQAYRNLYCPEVGLMRGKDEHGNWRPWLGSTEFHGQACMEANPLQQTWFVPHDPRGLIELMGRDRFLAQLEAMFERTPDNYFWNPYYNHSNEPVHQLPYIFPYAGAPWLTQKWVRHIMQNAYGLGPEGLCGNEDIGQMSAWFLLSAMGIHPFCTGSNIFIIGSPLFPEIEIDLNPTYHRGKTLRIVAHNNGPENIYIQSARLNGQSFDRAWITYEELTAGAVLEFDMGVQPNYAWATMPDALPPAVTTWK